MTDKAQHTDRGGVWFSVSAGHLVAPSQLDLSEVPEEEEYPEYPGVDWEAVGHAVRRLFCLTGPAVPGADPQGAVTAEAIDTVCRDLGEVDSEIVTSWIENSPRSGVAFGSPSWMPSHGLRCLSEVWSVHPQWAMPLRWEGSEPQFDCLAVANQTLDAAAAILGWLAGGRIELQNTVVNEGFIAALDELATRERFTIETTRSSTFTFDVDDHSVTPQVFGDEYGYSQLWAWSHEAEVMVVIDYTGGLRTGGRVVETVMLISQMRGNEELYLLISACQRVHILAAEGWEVHARWIYDVLAPSELVPWRSLTQNSAPDSVTFGGVAWRSTVPRSAGTAVGS